MNTLMTKTVKLMDEMNLCFHKTGDKIDVMRTVNGKPERYTFHVGHDKIKGVHRAGKTVIKEIDTHNIYLIQKFVTA